MPHPSSTESYIYIEICTLALLLALWRQPLNIRELHKRGFFLGTTILFLFWWIIDELAVSFQIWTFPPEGTLPIRILRLPIEEYIIFLIHSGLTFALIALLRTSRGKS
jgi:lycopene cyclase domain-containing protein